MDITDKDISFDQEGVCNHCLSFDRIVKPMLRVAPEQKERYLKSMIEKIKQKGKNKPYDAVVGVSGGVDSSYLAHLSHQWGLRILAVHFDNGWNTELSVKNIDVILSKLNIDLKTYVVDWNEFRDVQRAFFKAHVVDIEMVTDFAIVAVVNRLAAQFNISYILSGTNATTEFVMPKSWNYRKTDATNLLAIHKKFGELKLKTFPQAGCLKLDYYKFVKGIQTFSPLDHLPYVKSEVTQLLINEYGWKNYAGKHYESMFTKFYQAHILPVKFNIDKRKAHLSNLICAGQMTREAALEELSKPLYDAVSLAQDKEYVLKKLGFTEQWFDLYLKTPGVPHSFYGTDDTLFNFLQWGKQWGKKLLGHKSHTY